MSEQAADCSNREVLQSNLTFRQATLDDVPVCFSIEKASYPSDEAATKESLEYRQNQATPYFRCAVLNNQVIGFICSTRCNSFEHESMSTHHSEGKILAIHSVVVKEECRQKGVAFAMMGDYVSTVKGRKDGIEKIVLLAKEHLLGFYVRCGYKVTKASDITHGKDLWYDLELDVRPNNEGVRALPNEGESWFVKTEQFCQPFNIVKPHLEAHRAWVTDLRSKGCCVTSGYRVDSEGKPGGGGMLFFAAKSYADAEALVLQDPLVANGCVDWQLNGWIAEVGEIQMR